ncbi:hypothetical protein MNBD_GAMMA23-901 [hydrothermal vent metagenome]|uniref:Phosphatidylserine decarboxylase n=1 Tax=hydrothermal vent metagenome TaxID=652676 RepID=A0A3B0ZF69_9ZZZZ
MIARESFWYILPVVIVAVILQYNFPFYAIVFWVLAILLAYLFRDSPNTPSSVPLAILSPVDSVVKSVSKVTDPYLEREAVCVELEMALTDPYTLYSVTEGKITNFWMQPKGEHKGKARAVWIKTDEDDDVVMEVYASRSGQLMCYYAAGERVGQGKKCGFLPFGSKVVIYLPENSPVDVKSGDRVAAGKDIIAHWPRS